MYVRKYDPPVMIDTAIMTGLSEEMTNIMNMNNDTPGNGFTDKDILAHVKGNHDEMKGFVDTLSFFKG